MADDVDDLLRRAMTTLDHQVPDGYFDTLASRTLARLDDPALGDPRDDNSGLRDIRNLASETKARMSSRRSSKDLIGDDDRLASSSAGWSAVALPEPGRLPAAPPRPVDSAGAADHADHIDELARERAAREAQAAHAREASAAVPAAPAAGQAAPARAGRAGSNRRAIFAVVGVGLAAAAGAVIFVLAGDRPMAMQERAGRVQDRADGVPAYAAAPAAASKPAGIVTAEGASADSGLTATPMDPGVPSVAGRTAGSAAAPEPTIEAQAGSAGRGDRAEDHAGKVPPRIKQVVSTDDVGVAVTKKPRPGKAGAKSLPSKGKLAEDTRSNDEPAGGSAGGPAPGDPGPREPGTGTPSGHGSGEPSFDKLLQEAGVHEKPGKPTLARKSLSSDDIKRGMNAAAPRAQACFAGTEGLAQLRLTVAPSGQVQQVTVTGAFAGTPVGACVERVVRAATFPPWDGGPQSFGYSYLLSD